ncbi:MAG: DUF427 domain-containing protein [Pseudomonadota bacterium]
MAKAEWAGVVLAESDDVEIVENYVYFPKGSVNHAHLRGVDFHTHCPWKGEASYFTVIVEGAENPNAAFCYPAPSKEARHLKGRIAFWKGVTITR